MSSNLPILGSNIPQGIWNKQHTHIQHTLCFFIFILHHVKTIVHAISNMKSPYKSSTITSDNYQVTLRVIDKRLFILSKQMFKLSTSILTQTHSHPCRWSISLSMTCCCSQTIQQSGTASDQQHWACACGRHTPAWHPDFIVNWIRIRVGLFCGHGPGAMKGGVAYI